MKKLSEQYYNAILSGNKEEAKGIKDQLNENIKLAQRQTKTDPLKVNTILNNDNSPALHIYYFLNEKYGEDWWDWEIETLEKMLWLDFGSIITENNIDKIQAIKMLINNQRPFLDWFYFNQLATALSGVIADFHTIKSPSPGMAISAMNTMIAIRPEQAFSRDVKKFVSLLLINDGIYTPPPSISDIIKEEFGYLISSESKDRWPSVLEKCKEMVETKNYGDKDDPVEVQAKRLLVAEESSNIYGG